MSKLIEDMALREVAAELDTYTALCSDEWQEGVDALIAAQRRTFCYSNEFELALDKELRAQLRYCRDHAEIVVETVTETVTHTDTYLKWDDQ